MVWREREVDQVRQCKCQRLHYQVEVRDLKYRSVPRQRRRITGVQRELACVTRNGELFRGALGFTDIHQMSGRRLCRSLTLTVLQFRHLQPVSSSELLRRSFEKLTGAYSRR